MNNHTESYYAESATGIVNHPALEAEITVDVCIVGGGYTGLSSAMHLAKNGYSVAVLESNRIGWGASGRNGGHVRVGQRQGQNYLEHKFGFDTAKLLWDLGLEAVDTVKGVIAEHDIDCDLREGILHVAHKEKYNSDLQQETEMIKQRYGYQQMRFVDKDEVRQMVGGQLDTGSAHLHPLNYALGMARAAVSAGAQLFENTEVVSYTEAETVVVTTRNGVVKAKELILACNGYQGDLEPRVNGKIMPINNFMLATEPLDEALATELIRDNVAVQDSRFVINYWRLSADNRLLFGGGENYSSAFPADIKAFVRKPMLKVYPQLEDTRLDYGWGGTLAITMNRLPDFGRLGNNIWYAHGYSGHGVPIATLAGKLLAEAIGGKQERFDLYANLPTLTFPGGTLLRWPGMVLGMLYYSLRDRF